MLRHAGRIAEGLCVAGPMGPAIGLFSMLLFVTGVTHQLVFVQAQSFRSD